MYLCFSTLHTDKAKFIEKHERMPVYEAIYLCVCSLSLSLSQEEESLPVDMMLELLDELFDIRDGGQWIRRQLPLLLKQLAGGKISRKIVETSDWLTSAEQVSGYIRNLGSRLWPGGFPAVSQSTPPMDVKALRTLVARAQLIGSIPGQLE